MWGSLLILGEHKSRKSLSVAPPCRCADRCSYKGRSRTPKTLNQGFYRAASQAVVPVFCMSESQACLTVCCKLLAQVGGLVPRTQLGQCKAAVTFLGPIICVLFPALVLLPPRRLLERGGGSDRYASFRLAKLISCPAGQPVGRTR
jgi:hypothetical protein